MSDQQNSEAKHSHFIEKLNSLRKLPNTSPIKILVVIITLGLICGVLVSTFSVLLKPVQVENMEKEQQRNLLGIIQRQPGIKDLFDKVGAQDVEIQIVDLSTGLYNQSINPIEYNQHDATNDPKLSSEIPPKLDIAKLKRRANFAQVYLVRKNGLIKFIILPVHGKGYASTLYAYLGLNAEADTVIGLNFYQHGESAGMGARITEQAWLDQWHGKKIRDADGKIRIGVARGQVIKDSPSAAYQVDGLSGATKTSRGVHNMVQFWLGDQGFGPYLRNLNVQKIK